MLLTHLASVAPLRALYAILHLSALPVLHCSIYSIIHVFLMQEYAQRTGTM